MANWSPAEWVAFFGGLTAFIGSLAAAVISVVRALRGVEQEVRDVKQSVKEHDVASAVRHSQTQTTLKGE